jgi:hypothetical protein
MSHKEHKGRKKIRNICRKEARKGATGGRPMSIRHLLRKYGHGAEAEEPPVCPTRESGYPG